MDGDNFHESSGPKHGSTDEDNFHLSGPKHMMSADSKIIIDWDNDEHRRCVTACLVKATYVMENDRIKCRMYNNAELLAPAWWKSFNFSLKKTFIDDSDETSYFTYGAIFELMAPQLHPSAPRYVVAFRGTMLKHPNVPYDLAQNSFLMLNTLPDHKRFQCACLDVERLISDLPDGSCYSVWLAGHSLGASMALGIGRDIMLEKEVNIPTFLFNPPHVSAAPVINKVLKGNTKTRLYVVSYTCKFALAQVLSTHHEHTKQLFQRLTPWVPELHVNPKDFICRGHIEYFEQRELVSKDHPRRARTAERMSYRDMISSVFGKYKNAQPHLLPSARLWTNSSGDKKEAHGLQQWWKPDCELVLTTTHYDESLGASA